MATSLAIITVLGLLSNKLFNRFKLLGLLGMILVGILIGSYGFDLLSDEIIIASADLRKIALIVILLRAVLGIKKEDIKKVEIAGLLGVMAIGFIIFEKMLEVGEKMASKINKAWVFAEILLFVLVGGQVNVVLAFDVGFKGILLITIGLIVRSIGVILSLIGTELNMKEKLFCILAYIPKTTVQAAIGAISLSMGVESGDLVLSLAVLSIIITAPHIKYTDVIMKLREGFNGKKCYAKDCFK